MSTDRRPQAATSRGAACLDKFLRFADLKNAGIVSSWPMVKRRVENDGFPPGRMFGQKTRAWTVDEVQAWVDSRPLALPARQKGRRGRPRKTQAAPEITITT